MRDWASPTEASTLAGEGDQVFMATACAFHSQKAVLEPAAAQVVREFCNAKQDSGNHLADLAA